jgi:hypothetical protein
LDFYSFPGTYIFDARGFCSIKVHGNSTRLRIRKKEREEKDFSMNNSLLRVVIAPFSRGFAWVLAGLAAFAFTHIFTSGVPKEVGRVNSFR